MSRMIKASEFKAKCLALMDEVERTGESVVITKNGKPVAELVPHRKQDQNALRHLLKDRAVHYGRHHLADRCGVGSAQVILLDTHAAIWFATNPRLG